MQWAQTGLCKSIYASAAAYVQIYMRLACVFNIKCVKLGSLHSV